MRATGREVSFAEIPSPYGHDAFLLEPEEQRRYIEPFLERALCEARVEPRASERGVTSNERRDLLRADLQLVISLVPEGSRVLDLGCGDGSLIAHLRDERGCDVRGIELAPEEIAAALGRGLSVVQADLDEGLAGYPDGAFDVVVLSQTIQVMRNPALVLREMLRVGQRGIVTFPNFGHWRVRGYLAFRGPHAGQRVDTVLVVRHAQHPPHHAEGLPRVRRCQRWRDRAGDSADRRASGASECARSAGGPTCSPTRSSRWCGRKQG